MLKIEIKEGEKIENAIKQCRRKGTYREVYLLKKGKYGY